MRCLQTMISRYFFYIFGDQRCDLIDLSTCEENRIRFLRLLSLYSETFIRSISSLLRVNMNLSQAFCSLPSSSLLPSGRFIPASISPQRISQSRRLVAAVAPSPTPPSSAAQPEKGKNESIRPLSSPAQRFYDFSEHTILSLRITHCRLLTADLAEHVKKTVSMKKSSLGQLASMLSVCPSTKKTDGDTGWFNPSSNEYESLEARPGQIVETIPAINAEFLPLLLRARPGAVQIAQLSYGWEIFLVSDVRHALVPTTIGATRKPGYAITGNMRRTSRKKPEITPRSYHIETLGCQMNASDSERMAASLEAAGYTIALNPKNASVYVLNTCALREHAQQKVYSYLGPHAQRKWDAPQSVTLVVAGCVAQQEGDRLLADVPELDVVMGPQYANRIDEVLDEFNERQAQIVAVDPVHIHEDISKPKRGAAVTAWVNVIYGCLEKCSYCVVPNTRGLEQSRSMESIREEVETLVRDGYREVVLLGQNVDAYGRDLSPKRTLSDLLRFIHDVDGLYRIRFTTGHPRYISENLINTVHELPKVMEHFHIPPQSGDSGVLKQMGRGYTRERYIEITRRIRAKLPDASICADMIVGFPGESNEAFENTMSLADEVMFDANMVRAYSARPNTSAALREDQVDEDVKKERLAIMNQKMKEHALIRSQRYMGRVVEVLVEGRNEKREGEMMGRERTNRVVFFEGSAELVGHLVEVDIQEAFTFSLRGTMIRIVT